MQFILGKAVIFSHVSVQSLGIPITQWLKKVSSLPSSHHCNYSPKKEVSETIYINVNVPHINY